MDGVVGRIMATQKYQVLIPELVIDILIVLLEDFKTEWMVRVERDSLI